ncbi:zinc-ribbon domain-containing protein [Flavobacterium piscis]|uniref:Zinc-ribbon domain-containing protein n=1 Tax=Flavobacterium piscis TaxID=1114874 RepID=A0ABU1YD63_9FLAO|nr:zinc-ribbon domain-containing protein [Flavobacterium piscis]MDR7212174.1 hypothetical protein [Flavobacterium piscis]
MIFFYGTKAANLRNGQIINVDCPNCNTNVSMTYSIFGKYGHLYWIPFFPIKKLTFAECNSCKKTFEKTELSSSIQQKLEREKEKNNVKTPIWMFSGLFLIAGIFVLIFYTSHQTDVNSENFIKSPKVGDIYFINSAERHYSTMKVDQVSKDSLVVFMNDMEIDSKTDIDKIDVVENYKKTYSVAKKDMLKLYKEEKIYEVKRD